MPDGSPDPTYTPTIGDRLDTAAGGAVSWKWYSGGWNDALAGNADPLFQYHHQPFAYYANYAPFNADGTPNAQNDALLNPNAHLQDETRFFTDLNNGTLPSVSFIKPLGPDNEHPGYADLLRGQNHVADIVHAVQNSADWAHTAIIITYDENGGRWDHVSPPNNNGIWGDGARVPTIVISPYAKQGYVDHQQHDTLSIMKTLENRFGLQPLNQYDAYASSLASSFEVQNPAYPPPPAPPSPQARASASVGSQTRNFPIGGFGTSYVSAEADRSIRFDARNAVDDGVFHNLTAGQGHSNSSEWINLYQKSGTDDSTGDKSEAHAAAGNSDGNDSPSDASEWTIPTWATPSKRASKKS